MLRTLRARLAEAFHLPSSPPFGNVDRFTHTRNWLAYLSMTQTTLTGEEFPSADSNPGIAKVYPRDQCERWDVQALPQGVACEHAKQLGLWIIPRALSEEQCNDVSSSAAELTGDGSAQGCGGVAVQPRVPPVPIAGSVMCVPKILWPWYAYERARWMVPLQPSQGVDPGFALTHLRTLQSHGCTDAHTWPLLSAISNLGGDALRLVEALPGLSIQAFANRKPLFLQLQALQRGAPITPHIDEPGVGGHAIATVLLQGPSDVRVGGVVFSLVAGDMYCLTGDAREKVDHEVYCSDEDRLSVTIRYCAQGRADESGVCLPRGMR